MPLSKSKKEEILIREAHKVLQNSYAPYSKIHVGAAILTKSGKIFTGANIENASYGLTLCAECGALASAISSGEKEFGTLAVVSSDIELPVPCGACRQVLYEFAPDIKIIMVGKGNKPKKSRLDRLLPLGFRIDLNK